MNTEHSDYYRHSLSNPSQLPRLIAQATADLIPIIDLFDAIAVRGVSGLLLGPAVAAALQKQLVVVRKSKVGSHADVMTEGQPYGEYRYIVLDDFICSGDSVRAMKKELHGVHVKTYLYGLNYDRVEDRVTDKMIDPKPEPETLTDAIANVPTFTLKQMAEKGGQTPLQRLMSLAHPDKAYKQLTDAERIFGVLAGVGDGTKT